MPSIITHHMFSKEILNHLNNKELNRFNDRLDIYHTFAQSHDYLFYYTFGKNRKKLVCEKLRTKSNISLELLVFALFSGSDITVILSSDNIFFHVKLLLIS